MEFDWDPAKSASNQAKHGLSLEAATALWDGPIVSIPSKQAGESRQLAIGRIEGSSWTVVYVLRDHRVRLISARRSRDNENAIYEKLIHP